jgi:ABC-type polysaccharide/polyol phosphate transport system ATPase subunit
VTSCDSSPALVELRGVGVFFRLHARGRLSLRQILRQRRFWQPPPLLWALRGIDLELRAGQSLAIVGHNGAGKSTLCLLLAQILTPDEGSAAVRGQVATLFGLGRGFNPELSGRDNIRLYSAFLAIPRAELGERMAEIIAFSELEEFIDEPVAQYSTGMRARLAFSVATSLQPEILILDEVLAVGDRAFQRKSESRIRALISKSQLIAIVSHQTEFLRETCTHALWLDHGRVRAFGPAPEVLDKYDAEVGPPEILPP